MKYFSLFLLCFLWLAEAQSGFSSYTVIAGDTLYRIATIYATSVDTIRSLNGLSGDALEIGQVLNVPATAQPVQVAAPQRSGVIQHTVGTGHTLGNLAQLYNISEDTLRAANVGLESTLSDVALTEGLILQIPPAEGMVVLIAPGQNLLAIALQHGMTVSELGKVNGVKNLRAGQYVFIPAANVQSAFMSQHAPAQTTAGQNSNSQDDTPQTSDLQIVSKQDFRALHLQAQKSVIARAVNLLAAHTPVVTSTQSFIWPIQGPITSAYGRRRISVGGNTFHAGVDVAAPTGTPIAATKSGTVVKAGWGGSYGYVVYIDHGDGTQTRYAHMSKIKVAVGTYVNQRDIIGLVGTTGASTGPHLHFEIRFEGRSVDPLGYLAVQ
jgi:murein DD-endopeptidase MepM/ murein hydrolase activator NlpD